LKKAVRLASVRVCATAWVAIFAASATWRPFGRGRNIALIASANNIFDLTARRAASFTKDFVPLTGRDFRVTARLSF
jgi:iron complex outermembrane receptor protein